MPSSFPATAPRWWRYVHERQVRCAAGHHIPSNAEINETGFIRCAHWVDQERRECGRWVFLFAVTGGDCVVAEVTEAERQPMRALRTPAAMLRYLGIFDVRLAG